MLLISIVTVFAATFLLSALAVGIAWAFIQRPKDQQGLINSEISLEFPGLLKDDNLSSISIWARVLEKLDVADRAKRNIQQAGLDISVGRLTSMMMLIAALTLAVMNGLRWATFPVAFVLALLVGFLPYAWLLRKRSKRLDLFEEQLPDSLDFLARALRAGHPFSAALELLANENQQPLSAEMRIAADERRLGRSWDDALRNLSRRVPLLNVRLFAAAVLLQTRTGGKLSEVLGQLAETMRESASLRGEVKAIAAHGRLTGVVLTVLPIAIALMMTWVNPDYMLVLLNYEYGRHLIASAVICLVLAHIIIQRIVDIRL